MRDQKTWSVRFMSVMGVALAVGVLLALGSTAASARVQTGPGATPDGVPVQFLELDKIEPSAGVVIDTKQAGTGSSAFTYLADLGSAAFAFPETRPLADATDRVFTNKDGSYFSVLTQSPSPDITDPHSLRGGISHFEELQAYRKRSGDATLRITISNAILARSTRIATPADVHRRPSATARCSEESSCSTPAHMRHRPGMTPVATSSPRAASRTSRATADTGPLAPRRTPTLRCRCGTGPVSAGAPRAHAYRRVRAARDVAAELRSPLTLTVPLDAVRANELFAVHVTLESEATNDRGGESTSLAFIDDPEHVGPGLLKARGLKPLGKPHFREPKVTPPPAAVCTARPSPHSGKVQLSRGAYAVTEDGRTPMVLVTRSAGSRGEISATVRTSGGSAHSGQDFRPTTTRVTFDNSDTSRGSWRFRSARTRRPSHRRTSPFPCLTPSAARSASSATLP